MVFKIQADVKIEENFKKTRLLRFCPFAASSRDVFAVLLVASDRIMHFHSLTTLLSYYHSHAFFAWHIKQPYNLSEHRQFYP